ncbi:MAG: hypothetical protein CSA70_03100 [Rhodobacterales bacterium]|nr:MAG: hypothetical protein CSA70_03100 [Rhodobacterales bacterium]
MSELKLIKTRLKEGVWEGVLLPGGEQDAPEVVVTLEGQTIGGVDLVAREEGGWLLRVPVPASAIADGIQTFLIREKGEAEVLESFSILAGEALGDDIRAEIDLLRAELDMLKRAFRRHCIETM